jgi:hypothetical protein
MCPVPASLPPSDSSPHLLLDDAGANEVEVVGGLAAAAQHLSLSIVPIDSNLIGRGRLVCLT